MPTNKEIASEFRQLSTPHIADACVRDGKPIRHAPPGIISVIPGSSVAGRVLPVRHYGSVDIFLEAIEDAEPGDVLVVDNGGRKDEACIGDLTALEAASAGVIGMVVWGLHRDTADLRKIGMPGFSYGSLSFGPRRVDPREPEARSTARFGELSLSRDDVVIADDDGVVFVADSDLRDLFSIATLVCSTERAQALKVESGETLRDQLKFKEYLAEKSQNPTFKFRDHLRKIGGAIEE